METGYTTDVSRVIKLFSRYLAQNGTWSSWGEWQSCDRECDGGVQVRSRDCLGNGNCNGDATVTQTCNNHTCPFDGYIGKTHIYQ